MWGAPEVRRESNNHLEENLEKGAGFWNQEFMSGPQGVVSAECAEQGQTIRGKGQSEEEVI